MFVIIFENTKHLTHISLLQLPFYHPPLLQGCNHDRGTSSACTNTNYNYGYRDPQARFRSILAYSCKAGQCDENAGGGCTRVQRFSNNYPVTNVYNGLGPIGNAQNDNARKTNDVAQTVASYFPTVPVASPTTTSPTQSPTFSPTSSPSTPDQQLLLRHPNQRSVTVLLVFLRLPNQRLVQQTVLLVFLRHPNQQTAQPRGLPPASSMVNRVLSEHCAALIIVIGIINARNDRADGDLCWPMWPCTWWVCLGRKHCPSNTDNIPNHFASMKSNPSRLYWVLVASSLHAKRDTQYIELLKA
jgi:hypothetical protein